MSSQCRVLYVDDNQDSRDLARVIFDYSGSGCRVVAAESANEALLLIEKEPFDFYIFDARLPEMSGVELCRYIRQFDRDTPILFFSGAARDNDVSAAFEAGASDYLFKPNDLQKLPQTVERFLRGCATEQPALESANAGKKVFGGIN